MFRKKAQTPINSPEKEPSPHNNLGKVSIKDLLSKGLACMSREKAVSAPASIQEQKKDYNIDDFILENPQHEILKSQIIAHETAKDHVHSISGKVKIFARSGKIIIEKIEDQY